MDLSQEDFEQIFEIFKTECDEHIQNLNSALISLEENPEQSHLIESIFRDAHSLKGAARMINFKTIEDIAHQMETILGKIKNEELLLSAEVNDLTLKGLDTIEQIVQNISEGGSETDTDSSDILAQLKALSKLDLTTQSNPSKGKKEAPKAVPKKKTPIITEDLALFSEETRAASQQLEQHLKAIGESGDHESSLALAFESAYALKGSARIVKHKAMGDLASSMEKLLQRLKEQSLAPSQEMFVSLFRACDLMKVFITEVEEKKKKKPSSEYKKALSEIEVFIKTLPHEVKKNKAGNKGEKAEKAVHAPKKKTEKTKLKIPKKKTAPSQSKATTSSVRVSSEKLDSLMGQAGELLIMKLKARQHLTDTQTIIHDFNIISREIKNKYTLFSKIQRQNNAPLEMDNENDLTAFTRSLGGKMALVSDGLDQLHKSLFEDFRQFSIILERLQDDVRKTRLFPFQTVLDHFPRMVRDLSSATEKKVKLETIGGSIELDKYILEQIKDPLMHIIRNCVDHGIESPEERIRLGKPETGQVKVEAIQKGNNALIQVSDDGKGIKIENLIQSAIKKSIYTQDELQRMKEKQIFNLIFHPGFSTTEIITDISGRGVGMDVVKSNIEKLNGTIDVETREYKGTVFSMNIPLTLSTTQSLKLSISGATYFLPVSMVERIVKVQEDDLPLVEGYPAVHYSGSYIPYVRLSSVLELPENPFDEDNTGIERPVAILKAGKTLAAFGIDLFLGEEEILMKGLGPCMKRVRNISGVTIMRDGTIAPVLNVTDMIHTVQLRNITAIKTLKKAPVSTHVQSVLVVDDSVMTRTLSKNIIESHGYRVTTAVDGQDAMSKIQHHHFDLIVSDIQMPNMDGFELTECIKRDKRTKDIPVVIVTALESVEDKKKGIEVGADAYIVKSSFDQSNLIQTIQRLL